MLKKCLKLFITGIIFIVVGGIGIATLAINGLLSAITLPVSVPVVAASSDFIEIEETETIHSLDFSSNAGTFTVFRGDSFTIESNGQEVSYEISDGCLEIVSSVENYLVNFDFTGTSSEIIVTIPNREFKEVELSLNAGELYAENITTDKLTLNFDAGYAQFYNLRALSEAEIDMDFVECLFDKCSFNNSKINMDAGDMNFLTSKLTGKNEINIDLGNLNLHLWGTYPDYEFDINNDMGKVTIAEDKSENIIEKTEHIGSITVNLDLGECFIDFAEEEDYE